MRARLTGILLLLTLTACTPAPAGPTPTVEPSPVLTDTPAAAPTAAEAAWWEGITLEELPETVTPAEEVAAGSNTLYLLSQIPEAEIFLYGYGNDSFTGVLLRRGEQLTHLDQPYLAYENPAAPELWWEDFDGDGACELAVQYLLVNTASRHLVQFHLYSPREAEWQDRTLDLTAQAQTLLDQLTCTFDTDSGMVQVSSGTLSASTYLEEPIPITGAPLTAGESIYFRQEEGDIIAVLPLGLALPNQSPLLFAHALCTVAVSGDTLTLELKNLEALYGV